MSRSQKTGQKNSIKIANTSFEDVAKFKYLVKTLTDQYHIHEEIKSRLKPENTCYHSVQNLLSSRLLSRNLKFKIYKTIFLSVVLYGCETWSLILREEHKLRAFEESVLRRILGPKRDEVTGEWRKMHNGELHNLNLSSDIITQMKSRRMRLSGHVARIREGRNVYRAWIGKPEGKRQLERPRRRWECGIKMDLMEVVWGVSSGFNWLRIGTVGGLL
jgi:hypothetical protein